MKTAWMAAGVLVWALNAGGAESVYREDFESYTPGKAAKGWVASWGRPGNDTFVVSSELSVSGDQSLQYRRTDGDGLWQSALQLPKFGDGVATLSFSFLLRGRAGDAHYRLMFRKSVASPHDVDLRLSLAGVSGQVGEKRFQLKDIAVEPEKWYGVSLSFPTAAGADREIAIALTDPQTGKTERATLPWRDDKTESGVLLWEFRKPYKDTSLFLDDIDVSVAPAK